MSEENSPYSYTPSTYLLSIAVSVCSQILVGCKNIYIDFFVMDFLSPQDLANVKGVPLCAAFHISIL